MDEQENWTSFWRNLAIGLVTLVLAAGGLAAGIWSHQIEDRIDRNDAIDRVQWEKIGANATYGVRLDISQRDIEQLQDRVREIEIRLGAKGR